MCDQTIGGMAAHLFDGMLKKCLIVKDRWSMKIALDTTEHAKNSPEIIDVTSIVIAWTGAQYE